MNVRLLDTDILIDVRRGYAPAIAWLIRLPDKPLLPGFAILELLNGCANKQEMNRARKEIAPFPVCWPTEAECTLALDYFTQYHLSHNIGFVDALIAACAVGRSAALCTFNVKHFRAIPGLVTEQPYTR